MSSTRTLIISNDFPPRIGGIESYVGELCRLLDDDVVVLTSRNGRSGADRQHDASRGFPVVRHGRVLLPTARVGRIAAGLMAEYGVSRVIFGAAAPLSLLAPTLRGAGAQRLVALSHGHEIWWARLPVTRRLLHRMAEGVDAFGVISDFTGARIAAVLSPAGRARLVRLPPPVDTDRFRPAAAHPADAPLGASQGAAFDPPRCIAVGRLVRQKGFDTLLSAWRQVLDGPAAALQPELVLVGDGPQRARLQAQVEALGLGDSVRFTGAVRHEQVVVQLQTTHVFALPVRTRWAGLNPEGLGLGFCEAAAVGLPVVLGRSGGAPETVRDGHSGFVVDAEDPSALAARLSLLLVDRDLAHRMGAAGRIHAVDRFSAVRLGRDIRSLLELDAASS